MKCVNLVPDLANLVPCKRNLVPDLAKMPEFTPEVVADQVLLADFRDDFGADELLAHADSTKQTIGAADRAPGRMFIEKGLPEDDVRRDGQGQVDIRGDQDPSKNFAAVVARTTMPMRREGHEHARCYSDPVNPKNVSDPDSADDRADGSDDEKADDGDMKCVNAGNVKTLVVVMETRWPTSTEVL